MNTKKAASVAVTSIASTSQVADKKTGADQMIASKKAIMGDKSETKSRH